MGAREEQIRCRKCNDTIPLDSSSCPHCGTNTRSPVALIAAITVGGIVGVVSLLNFGELWFFGLIGFGLAVGAGALLYDRRQRIEES